MAERDVFSRLKKLFSSSIIVRNIGGDQIKVVDINSIQQGGDIKTNSLIDRFNRIYTTNPSSLYGSQFNQNYKFLRPQLYSEYDTMDLDAIVASSLDIMADEATLKNDMGEILQIRSSNDNIQQVLYNLFYDVLNIEFNLWSWIRQMCKYGDFFLKLEIAEKYGVYNILPYTAYHIERQEAYDLNNPSAVRFKYSPEGIMSSGTGMYTVPAYNVNDNNGIYFDNYEMAHFRLISDVNYLPYGRSIIEPGRKLFKQYCLDGNTKIWTPNGYNLIKDIKPGEKVLSFNNETGLFEPTEVINSQQTGVETIYKIKTPHRTLELTNDHPILTENGTYETLETLKIGDKIIISNGQEILHDETPIIKIDDNEIYVEPTELGKKYLSNKTFIYCKECGKKIKTFNSGAHLKNHNISIEQYKEKWGYNSTYNITYNKQFIRGDYRLKLTDVKEQLLLSGLEYDKNHFNHYYKNQQSKLIPSYVLNNNINRIIKLFGFMLGDGWIDYNNDTFCFSLGNRLDKSLPYYDSLIEMGFNPIIQKDNSTLAQVNLSNKQLIKIFEDLEFKTGTSNKFIPKWVFSLPIDLQKEFIDGFTDADGCLNEYKNKYQVAGINEELIKDFKYLCERVGYRTTNIWENKPTSKIFNGTNYDITTTCYTFAYYKENNIGKSIEKITYIEELDKRPVYDIEVESENHNFIANGIVVHNCLMEDAMLIHRISRAPEKRIFYINIGGIPPNEVDAFMQKTISNMKRTPYINKETGDYNLKYNMQNMLEDFYIPVRGNDVATKIETAKGLEYTGLEDVTYLRDKLFAALKVPRAFMGYTENLQGKCIDPLTKIPLLDGRTLTVQEIIDEYNNGIKNYVYSLNTETNNIVPGEIEWAGFTRMNTQTVKVWLDNGEYIRCTPDHKFLTRNGEWKEAQNLVESESLMPLYLKESEDENYKVSRIEWCDELIDTCDITVKEFHNFGTDAGVIIHNSTLAAQDIRFARTIERIQRIVISELNRIALVHLYAQGYRDEVLTNFELSLTTPSIIYDQERIELMKSKAELSSTLLEQGILPTDWIYDNIYHLSEDQFDEMRDLIREDAKRKFRLGQIENEGNDPQESGKSYGTPHDLASLYGKGRMYTDVGNVPQGESTNPDLGRPKESITTRGKQENNFGKDSLGVKGMKDKDKNESDSIRPTYKGGGPLALESTKKSFIQNQKVLAEMDKLDKKIMIFEQDNNISFLDEKQLED